MIFDYVKHTILLTVTGSRAYGVSKPESDTDYKGVIIPPTVYYKSFIHNFEQKESLPSYGKDSIVYELKKFFKLASDANPSILDILFAPEDLVVINTAYGSQLRKHRYAFLSKKVKYTYCGYAFHELKKIQNKINTLDKSKRNPARLELEKKFGYDTKNAMHLVRLMTTCKEILANGELLVRRPDASTLLKIRDGEWSLEHLLAWVEASSLHIEEICKSSTLPDKPDYIALNNLCVEILEQAERDNFPDMK